MTFICYINDIPEEEQASVNLSNSIDDKFNCLETELDINGQTKPVFLLRHNGGVKAYINACPHTGAKLNWQEGLFLDSEKHYIQCSIHGALFEKESGLCIHGPCAQQHLSQVDIIIENEKVLLK